MTVRVIAHLTCDVPGCTDTVSRDHGFGSLRAAVAASGWTADGLKDICPKHSAIIAAKETK